MSFNANELTDFVKDNAQNIATKAVLGSRTKDWVTVQPGIKSSENLTNLVSSAILQAGACGWNPQGTTKLGKRELKVADLMDQEELCTKDLETKFLQLEVAAGASAGAASMPVEEIYVNDKIKVNAKACDKLFWRGDESSLDTSLNSMDGILTILATDIPDAGTTPVTVAAASTVSATLRTTLTAAGHGYRDRDSITISGSSVADYDGVFTIENVTTNTFDISVAFNGTATATSTELDQKIARTASVEDDVDSLIAVMPEEMFDDEAAMMVCAMSVTNYNKLIKELKISNNFHFTGEQGTFSFVYPGFNLTIVAMQGMSGSNAILLYHKANLYWGTDLESDHEDADFFYSREDRVWKWHLNYRLGAQVAFPNEVALAI